MADTKITDLTDITPVVGDQIPVNVAAGNTDGMCTVGEIIDIINGDVNVDSSGSSTIAATSVTNAMLAGSIAASKLIGTDIATVGTITTGTWTADVIASAYLDADTAHLSVIQTITGAKTFNDATLILAGSTSGTTTLKATAIAGTTTITFPAATDTVVTLAATQTLTNKTLTSPTLTTPALGTPASGVLTNCTGTAAGLTAGNVTTNANLTGDVTSVGNATTIAAGAVDIAMLSASGTPDGTTFLRGDNTWAVPAGSGDMVLASAQTSTGKKTFQVDATNAGINIGSLAGDPSTPATGDMWYNSSTGYFRFRDAGVTRTVVTDGEVQTLTNKTLTSPTLTTPVLGTPSSGTLTNCTGLPLAGLTNDAKTQAIIIAGSDESTAISTTGEKTVIRSPYAFTVTGVRASLNTACTTGTFTVDIHESGTTILSTKITIDATETTSTTAATPAVISDSAIADDAEISIEVDNAGDNTATGLKVVLIGYNAT